jgi:hypothetical protein
MSALEAPADRGGDAGPRSWAAMASSREGGVVAELPLRPSRWSWPNSNRRPPGCDLGETLRRKSPLVAIRFSHAGSIPRCFVFAVAT